MAKAKYVELIIPADLAEIPQHSLAGYESVSDYVSEGKRRIFLKRPDVEAVAPTKPKQKRKPRAAKSQPSNAGSQTSFPGTEVANG